MEKINLRNKAIDLAERGQFYEALEYLKQAINEGDTSALNDAGVVSERMGLDKEAFDYYSRAVELGVGAGWRNLANFYRKGIVVKQDYEKAIKYFIKAAELGFTDAYYDLYEIYISKEYNGKRNYKKAIGYLRTGAFKEIQKNNADEYGCIMELNYNLANGRFIRRNEKESFDIIYKAKDMKSAPLKFNLACHYLEGYGVKKDINIGMNYLYDSCHLGYPNAFYKMAMLWIEGKEVKRDMLKGYYFLRRGMDVNSLKCNFKFIELCFMNGKELDFNLDEGKIAAMATYDYLEDHKEKYIEERREYEELKKRFKDVINFEKLENIVHEIRKERIKPKILA